MKTFLAALLFASVAFAQEGVGPNNGGISRANFLRIPDYRTPGTGLQTYFVDGTLGSDSNNCSASGASACATIQSAINRVPKLLRDQVTINVAAGSYAGFIVSGFYEDVGLQQSTGGLLIDGAMVTSTLATGSATGTATGGAQRVTTTYSTLTDTGATWTVNDLAGRFITTVSGTNTKFLIVSNTATVISVLGNWSSVPVGATTTYTIQDPSVIITGAVTLPPTPTSVAAANRTAIYIADNNMIYRTQVIAIEDMRIATTTATLGVEVEDYAAVILKFMQVRPTGVTTGQGVTIGRISGGGFLVVQNVDISMNTSSGGGTGVVATGDITLSVLNTRITNAQNQGTGIAIGVLNGLTNLVATPTPTVLGAGLANIDISGYVNGIFMTVGQFADQSNGTMGSHITCGTTAGIGIGVGPQQTGTLGGTAVFASVRDTLFATCDTAVLVRGAGSTADIISMSGTATTVGVAAQAGGVVSFAKAGVTLTAGTNEINEDVGQTTANFADVTAGLCIGTASQSSRVCGR